MQVVESMRSARSYDRQAKKVQISARIARGKLRWRCFDRIRTFCVRPIFASYSTINKLNRRLADDNQ